MSRLSIKKATKDVLQTVSGVKSVYTNLPRQQQVFPAVVVTVGKSHEKVVAKGMPGRRHITYDVTLYIQTIDNEPDEQASQDRFDDLLDAIDTALRANPSLNGVCLTAAQNELNTDTFEPQISGQGGGLILRAIKTFNAIVEIVG